MFDTARLSCTASAKLSDIAAINPRHHEPLATDEAVSFVSMSGLSAENACVVVEQTKSYAEVAKGYTRFLDRDVLVAKITPCFENNKIGQATLTRSVGFGSTEFHVIRPYKDKADPRYVMHYLRQDYVRAAGERKMTGSAGQRRVPEYFLASLSIPLPCVSEQRHIAAILDQADALRAKRRAALAHLDEMAHATFAEMFGDLRRNPRGWEANRVLDDVAEIASGITKGRRPPTTSLRPVPYLAVANVQDLALDLRKLKVIEASEEEIARFGLRHNDLVLTEGGDPDKLGRGVLWNGEVSECIHQNHVFRVRLTSPDVHPLFLNWLVGSSYGKSYFLRSAKQTTGIASINMTQLRAFPLLLPPRALQDRFAENVAAIGHAKSHSHRSGSELDALFASLQHRAFSGAL